MNLAKIAAHPFGRWLLHEHPRVSALLARGVANLERDNARAEQNLTSVFPERPARRLARAYRRSMFEYAVEQAHLDLLSHEELVSYCTNRVELAGAEHLDRALNGDGPVVVFTPHYGNFAVAALRIGLEACGRKKVHFFFNPPEKNPYSPRMQRLFRVLDCGVDAIMNDRAGLVKASRALDRGELVGIMPDVADVDPRSLFVPFFGRLAVAMGGTAHLALRSNATLLPLYAWRTGAARFVFEIDAPLPLARAESMDERVYETTAAIFRNMEQRIAAQPEHWMYWDTFASRVFPGVALAKTEAGWREQLSVLQQIFAPGETRLGTFLAELATRVAAGPR